MSEPHTSTPEPRTPATGRPHPPATASPSGLWESVDALWSWLHQHTARDGHDELLLRMLKLQEEVGEAAQAVIGATGQNPRKGRSHSWEDVQAELCDVVITALVALRTLTPEPHDVFTAHLDRVTRRSLGAAQDMKDAAPDASEAPGRAVAAAGIPARKVITEPESVARYAHDEAEWAPHGQPLAVVRPRDTDEVRAVVAHCAEHRIPVIPRGAGTGLSGGANAVDGAVILSFEDMNRILRIDPVERIAVVQPGVVNDDLRAACAEQGLWYPPDPASSPWSTIGGNAGTNAGGMCCVKYGVTRDYVLGLEVVNGLGEVVRLGRQTAKGVAGYDLCALLVGSEGTLGVITEITVKLRGARPAERTVAGFFDSVVTAGDAVRRVTEAGIVPSALELLDRHCLKAVDDWKHMGLSADADAILLGRIDAPGAEGDAEAERMRQCFADAGAAWAEVSTDQQEADALFQARRLAYPALERLGPVLTEDVVVPRAKVPEMLARVEEISARHEVLIANIAHAGDGNLHPLIITDPGDEAARARAQLAFEDILDAAIGFGGTVTGEHGVGLLKMGGMGREVGPVQLAMQRAVKAALDPYGILNPGKVVESGRPLRT